MLKYAGVTLDWYDDKGATLKGLYPKSSDVPSVIKTAAVEKDPDRLPNNAFALVATDDGKVLRKFACYNPGTTAMSVIYFLEHGDKLPLEAQKLASANLIDACAKHGIKIPSALEKRAGLLANPYVQSGLAGAAGGALGGAIGGAVGRPDDRAAGALRGAGRGAVGGALFSPVYGNPIPAAVGGVLMGGASSALMEESQRAGVDLSKMGNALLGTAGVAGVGALGGALTAGEGNRAMGALGGAANAIPLTATGALFGGLLHGREGALIGGALGAVGGGLVGGSKVNDIRSEIAKGQARQAAQQPSIEEKVASFAQTLLAGGLGGGAAGALSGAMSAQRGHEVDGAVAGAGRGAMMGAGSAGILHGGNFSPTQLATLGALGGYTAGADAAKEASEERFWERPLHPALGGLAGAAGGYSAAHLAGLGPVGTGLATLGGGAGMAAITHAANAKHDQQKEASIMDITGKSAPIKTAARSDDTADYAVITEDGRKLYPIDSADNVKLASAYWSDNKHLMEPAMRRQYATKLASNRFNIPVAADVQELGAPGFGQLGKLAQAIEIRKLAFDRGSSERKALSLIFEKRAALGPEIYARTLQQFDMETGLNHRWDSDIPDPFSSTFGKEADTVVWEEGADRVTASQLHNLALNYQSSMERVFTDELIGAFGKDPVGIFDSLPLPQKKIMARLADNLAHSGGSESMWITSGEGVDGKPVTGLGS